METINKECSGDAWCRYKMATLEVKTDGRSKQRRTWLLNLTEVCEQIHRSPELLFQWYTSKGPSVNDNNLMMVALAVQASPEGVTAAPVPRAGMSRATTTPRPFAR